MPVFTGIDDENPARAIRRGRGVFGDEVATFDAGGRRPPPCDAVAPSPSECCRLCAITMGDLWDGEGKPYLNEEECVPGCDCTKRGACSEASPPNSVLGRVV
jgi:hypothetical protein